MGRKNRKNQGYWDEDLDEDGMKKLLEGDDDGEKAKEAPAKTGKTGNKPGAKPNAKGSTGTPKAADAAGAPEPAAVQRDEDDVAGEDGNDLPSENNDGDNGGGDAPLTKNQKKRLKEKEKKRMQQAEKEKAAENKKGKQTAMGRKIAQLQALRKEQEEQARKEEEERLRLEAELLRKQQEEEAERERLRELKRQKQKAKPKLTAAQKREQQRLAQARARLEAMGMQVKGPKAADSAGPPQVVSSHVKAVPIPSLSELEKKFRIEVQGELNDLTKQKEALRKQHDQLLESKNAASADAEDKEEASDGVADAWDASLSDSEEENGEDAEQKTAAALADVSKQIDDVESKMKNIRETIKTRAKEERDRLVAERKKKAQADRAAAANADDGHEDADQASGNDDDDDQEDDEDSEGSDTSGLRSPICCVLGHVDTGKTKLLDRIRRTNVQGGEAGGITQQIGATYFPLSTLKKQTSKLQAGSKKMNQLKINVPGLLVIDTPGHESFTNLRSRGSNLCDIAVLVVDIMHGLEPQTLESISLLRKRKTPFIVALNKVDRLYDWKSKENAPIRDTLRNQKKIVQQEFETRVNETVALFADQELNACLYWKNTDFRKYVSLVPTSAISGEGIPDLLMLLIQLTQKMMPEKMLYLSSLQCSVLEVKVVEGFGTTIDVVLVNGELHEGDTIVVSGMNGAIVTTIRALLTPHPGKEMRVKGQYLHHKTVTGAIGVKIAAREDLDGAIAGSRLLVAGPDDDIDDLREEAEKEVRDVMNRLEKSDRGVHVQASTLGSMEALLSFLKDSKIPVASIGLGPVFRKDVVKASIMLDRDKKYACILAFDVKIEAEAKAEAEKLGVTVFSADIIYHLFDSFTEYLEKIKQEEREATKDEVVWPAVCKILPDFIFHQRDPIVLGVEVTEGTLRIGTPMCIMKTKTSMGRVTSIEKDHKAIQAAEAGSQVAIKIQPTTHEESSVCFGRHFDEKDMLSSLITRRSIDVLKQFFKDDVTKDDKLLIVKLKKVFAIQ